jgi:hypothetical protein
MRVVVDYRVMDTHIRITIYGVNAETVDFTERLGQFLAVGQPWSEDPNVRIAVSVQASDYSPAT